MINVDLATIVTGTILLFLIDLPWLYVNQSWAGTMLRNIQKSAVELRIFPAVLVYVFLSYLLLIPKSYGEAFLLGVSVYGVYDATNYSTLKNYSPYFAVADTVWGGVLMSTGWWIKKHYL